MFAKIPVIGYHKIICKVLYKYYKVSKATCTCIYIHVDGDALRKEFLHVWTHQHNNVVKYLKYSLNVHS